jgi:acyl-CoA thioester hydrolase
MPPRIHEQSVRVRYEETDRMGVVYYSNYFVYFEVGRTELMRSLGVAYRSLEDEGIHLPVSEASCRYLGSLHYDDLALVETWISGLGKARITFDYRISRLEGDRRAKVAEGSTTLACLSAEGRPRRFPETVRSLLREAMGQLGG